jgi:hypothetical protein
MSQLGRVDPRALAFALAASLTPACGERATPAQAPSDASTSAPSDATPGESRCLSSQPSRLVEGERRWPWRIHWSAGWLGDQIKTLAEVCDAYGEDATVAMTVDVLSGRPSGPPMTFEAPCTAAELLVDLPSELVFHGSYTVRSMTTGRSSGPSIMSQDVHCSRDVYFSVWAPR